MKEARQRPGAEGNGSSKLSLNLRIWMPRSRTEVTRASESNSSKKWRLVGVNTDRTSRGVAVRSWIGDEGVGASEPTRIVSFLFLLFQPVCSPGDRAVC